MLSYSNFGETVPLIELNLFPCNFYNHTASALGDYTREKKKRNSQIPLSHGNP